MYLARVIGIIYESPECTIEGLSALDTKEQAELSSLIIDLTSDLNRLGPQSINYEDKFKARNVNYIACRALPGLKAKLKLLGISL